MKKFMNYFLASILLVSISDLNSSDFKKVENSYWNLSYDKFSLDGHDYIHFYNPWYGRQEMMVHDPDCSNCQEGITLDEIMEEIKKACHASANPQELDIFFQEIRQTILTVKSDEYDEDGKKKKERSRSSKHKHKS